ncbi:Eco57I restriction-modification methylase domain-containing protein [Candidatus Hydrogenedentota bacterium]
MNNIYGVDIDTQAVEVTKLSLLLKVLENENDETINAQLQLWHERALPDLSNNIKCGNSLIGSDFYAEEQLTMFDEEEHYRINAFDWEVEFAEIMSGGGFDAVIGNPPYIRIQTLKEWHPDAVSYYKDSYRAASKGNYDIYVVFVEKGAFLLKPKGVLGFILPSKFISTDYGRELRRSLSEERLVSNVVDFAHSQVFQNATTYTCLLFLAKRENTSIEYVETQPEALSQRCFLPVSIAASSLTDEPWLFKNAEEKALIEKLNDVSTSLLNLPASMSRGISTGADEVFCLNDNDGVLVSRDGCSVDIEESILRRPLYASDFSRYRFLPKNQEVIIFPYKVDANGYSVIEEVVLKKECPKAYDYLKSCQSRLEKRKQYKQWYGYSAPRNLDVHEEADILVPLLANRPIFAVPSGDFTRFCVMASSGFTVRIQDVSGNINSKSQSSHKG